MDYDERFLRITGNFNTLCNSPGLWPDSSNFFSFLLLSWKNCCIISAHSASSTPRRIFIFGWNGWRGAAGFPATSGRSSPSAPSEKSLIQLPSAPRSLLGAPHTRVPTLA
uniref:Uncharacterized protein n=1 Tax=Opuntia streptacantha TaxID=393608 RepID=A0A7C9A0C5_OPUST